MHYVELTHVTAANVTCHRGKCDITGFDGTFENCDVGSGGAQEPQDLQALF